MHCWQTVRSFLPILASILVSWSTASKHQCGFSNHFAVEVDGDHDQVLALASQHGFQCRMKVFDEYNIYDFVHPEISNCSYCESKRHLNLLQTDPKVKWVEQQAFRAQTIRRVLTDQQVEGVKTAPSDKPRSTMTFNDPFYQHQWYLHNEGQTGAPPGNDLNVMAVWQAGFTGRGITLSVLDDGLQHTNPDIHLNYEPSVSYDLVDFDTKRNDPMPDGRPENSHGTYCAGVIAAVANNSICGVGVAYNAKVGGVRVLDGPVTDLQEALALSLAVDKVDVYSASWGPRDDGRHISGPGKLASLAFEKGIRKGRKGRGAIYVWAVGNGGLKQDNCNMDGYVSSIYTLAVSALTDTGMSAYYTEPCAATLASTFVGGLHSFPSARSVETWKDIRRPKVVVTGLEGECMESFQGTSAAAPMAAGVIALLLEANPNVTWRDVQHIVVESVRVPNADEAGWQVNGAGYHFHLMYGFGVMDAARMVHVAQRWVNVEPRNLWTVEPQDAIRPIYPGKNTTLSFMVEFPEKMHSDHRVNFLEYVIVTLDVKHVNRGSLELFVESPFGTESQVLTRRPTDTTDKGIKGWGFMSVHFWGENPEGQWTVRVFDHTDPTNQDRNVSGSIEILLMTLHGTGHQWPMKHIVDHSRLGKAFLPDTKFLSDVASAEIHISSLSDCNVPNLPTLNNYEKIGDSNGKNTQAKVVNDTKDETIPGLHSLIHSRASSQLRKKNKIKNLNMFTRHHVKDGVLENKSALQTLSEDIDITDVERREATDSVESIMQRYQPARLEKIEHLLKLAEKLNRQQEML